MGRQVEPLVDAAPVFAALGDQTRLRIVTRLCARGPQSIVRLSAGAGVTRQAVTKHLHALAEAGLVHSTREGRQRIWEMRTERLDEVRRYLDQISQQWDSAIARLRAHVETVDTEENDETENTHDRQ
jgi:DNA-binding transcriptional ArsR family regulator